MIDRRIWIALMLAATPAVSSTPAFAQVQLGSKPQQLLYVAIEVGDFQKERSFYMGVIGLKELGGSNSTGKGRQSSMLSFSGAFDDSFLMISHDDAQGAPKPGILQRLTFKVIDVKAVVERARAAGGKIVSEPADAHNTPGMVTAIILDPDGNRIELVQSPPPK